MLSASQPVLVLVGSVSRTGTANHVRLCLSGQTQRGGEEEEEEETHIFIM